MIVYREMKSVQFSCRTPVLRMCIGPLNPVHVHLNRARRNECNIRFGTLCRWSDKSKSHRWHLKVCWVCCRLCVRYTVTCSYAQCLVLAALRNPIGYRATRTRHHCSGSRSGIRKFLSVTSVNDKYVFPPALLHKPTIDQLGYNALDMFMTSCHTDTWRFLCIRKHKSHPNFVLRNLSNFDGAAADALLRVFGSRRMHSHPPGPIYTARFFAMLLAPK